MIFEHFENFIDNLCSMSGEVSPNFVVKKDLFNYFDSKKDGYIDISEWQEVFKRIEVSKNNQLSYKNQLKDSNRLLSLNQSKITSLGSFLLRKILKFLS